MRAEEVTEQNSLIDSDQASAVKNIEGGEFFSMRPDVFKQNKVELQPTIDYANLPPIATPTVAEFVSRDPEHAAAISPESEHFSSIEKMWNHVKTATSRKVGPEVDLTNYNWKELRSVFGQDTFTQEDKFNRMAIEEELSSEYGEPALEYWESIPGDVAAAIADQGAIAWRNKKLIGGFTASGALGGAVQGAGVSLVTGGTAAAPLITGGAIRGGLIGLGLGQRVSSAYDAYKSTAASTFSELKNAKDADNNPLNVDAKTRGYISLGVGAGSAVITAVAEKYLLKNAPFLKRLFNPKNAADILTNPARSQLREALVSIGKVMISEGTEEGLQEIVQVVGEEIGNTYANSEVSVANGLLNATKKILTKEGAGRVGYSVAVGSLAGGVTSGTLAGIDAGYQSIVTKAQTPEAPMTPIPKSDISDDRGTPQEQAIQSLIFQDVVENGSKIATSTKLNKLSPHITKQVRTQIAKNNGVNEVWFDGASLSEFTGQDEVKAADVRSKIGSKGEASAQLNAPIRMPVQEFLELQDKYPTIAEYAKLNPAGPDPKSAKVYLEKLREANIKRTRIREKLDIGQKSFEEQAYDVRLSPNVDDSFILDELGSKEVADAYLDRLDVNAVEAQGDAAKLADIQQMRERVTALRDKLPDDKTAKQILTEALDTPQPVNDVFGEEDYLNQPMYPADIEAALPEGEVKKQKELEMAARQSVVDNINESAIYEMNKVADVYEEMGTEALIQEESEKLANDPNVQIVERFISKTPTIFPNERYRNETEAKDTHHKAGFSTFAIDPRTLTDSQKAKYLKDPRLRKRRAFVKGGKSPDMSAQMIGLPNGEMLLDILARTPTTQETLDAKLKLNQPRIRQDAIDAAGLDNTAIVKAYRNKTRNVLEQMKFMLSESWPTTKRGLKRIALDLPRIETITNEARFAVSQTTIGELNATQFKVGMRRSHRAAFNAMADGDLEGAFVNKRAQALNNELAIATHIAIAEVNRVIKFARKLNTAEMKRTLSKAGKSYTEAVNELLDVYNLRPSSKGLSETGAYQKWVEQQVKEGNDNFEIPARLSDVKESINDMTVEEVRAVGDRLRSIVHQAKRKNFLYEKYGDPAKQTQYVEALVAQLHQTSLAHPDYNPNGVKEIERQTLSPTQKAVKALNSLNATMANVESILLNADNDKYGGKYVDYGLSGLKGIGTHKDMGEAGKARDMAALAKQIDKIKAAFGKKEFERMGWKTVNVPEFASIPALNNGKMTQADLFSLLLNMGNEGNLDRLKNFGASVEDIKVVVERELDHKHMIAAQQIMDTFNSYFPRVRELHKKTLGHEIEMVQATPITFKGKVYPGGYYPLMYKSEMSPQKVRDRARKTISSLNGDSQFALHDHFYVDDMTRRNHTERRTGSDRPLMLGLGSVGMGFEMILHDLNFRIPIADALRLFTHKSVEADLINTVGQRDYNVVVNSIIDAAGSVQMENNFLFDSANLMKQGEAKIRAGISVAYLVGNVKSIMIQPASLFFSIDAMGYAQGVKHLSALLGKVLTNPSSIGQIHALAADINPAVFSERENINENTRDVISRKMPQKYFSKGTIPFAKIQEAVSELGYWALGVPDKFMKASVTVAAYNQYLNGDAGVSLAELNKMSAEERDHKARVYATSIVRTTQTSGTQLDRSEIQKVQPLLTMFFNDRRNIYNNSRRAARRIRQGTQATVEGIRTADFSKVKGGLGVASTGAATLLLTTSIARMYMDLMRGNPTPISDEELADDPEGFLDSMVAYLSSAPVLSIAESIPLMSDALFAFQREQQADYNMVTTATPIIGKVATDIKDTMVAAYDFVYNYELQDMIDGEAGPNKRQVKAIGFMMSYLTGGVPVNLLSSLYEQYEEGDLDPNVSLPGASAEEFKKDVEEFKEEHGDEVPQDMMEAIEEVANAGVAVANPIPENAKSVIKQIESAGDPFAQNPNSSAAGLYQFTEGTWDYIRQAAPELGLTEEGRIDDISQQEDAMDWFMEQNSKTLRESGIEPTTENLYAAHFLGAQGAVEVLNSKGDTKMKSLVSDDVLESNGFARGMKVKDFKSWVTKKVKEAIEKIDKTEPDLKD